MHNAMSENKFFICGFMSASGRRKPIMREK